MHVQASMRYGMLRELSGLSLQQPKESTMTFLLRSGDPSER